MFDDKAQMHTLEGVAAATIMLLVIVYAIDATSMTPLTSSTANVHVETELQVLGQDILGALDYAEPGYNSMLKNDVLTWNGSEYIWSGTNYMEKGGTANLANNLTNILNATLIGQGIAHNVALTFLSDNGASYSTERMIYNGDPSENAVIVSRKIVLQNTDFTPSANYPIPDIDPSTNLYNIVDVKLILWRM
ncbi:MAG: hypothetical protein WA102_07890 [Candidatus Methanoperedens sp.]